LGEGSIAPAKKFEHQTQLSVPEGYIVFRPKTYHLYVGLRPVAVNGGTM
jgi:hypothetical protein